MSGRPRKSRRIVSVTPAQIRKDVQTIKRAQRGGSLTIAATVAAARRVRQAHKIAQAVKPITSSRRIIDNVAPGYRKKFRADRPNIGRATDFGVDFLGYGRARQGRPRSSAIRY